MNHNTLGLNIRFQRLGKGLTTKEMAEKIPCEETTFYRYEAGLREPKQEIVRKIADILEIEPSELISSETSNSLFLDYIVWTERDGRPFEVSKRYEELRNQYGKVYQTEVYSSFHMENAVVFSSLKVSHEEALSYFECEQDTFYGYNEEECS